MYLFYQPQEGAAFMLPAAMVTAELVDRGVSWQNSPNIYINLNISVVEEQ